MSRPAPARTARPPWVPILAGAALVVAVVVVFLLLRGGEEDASPTPAPPATAATGATGPGAPAAATPEQLTALSKRLKRPVYWTGEQPGTTYELTETGDGQLYVRYLTGGAKAGDERPSFLTVGTYAQEKAFATVQEAAERKGAQTEELPRGGLAVANRARPESWYLAYPDGGELVEVYAPKAGRARELVRRGRVVPVPGG